MSILKHKDYYSMKNTRKLNIFIIFFILIMFISTISMTNKNFKEKLIETRLSFIERSLIDNKHLIDNIIESKYSSLQAIASLSEIQTIDWERAYPVLLSKAEEFNFKHLFIMDKNGLGYYAENNIIRDQSEEEFYKEITGNKKSIIEPFVLENEKFSIITLVVPIFDENGMFVGNLCGAFDIHNISDIIQEINSKENISSFIINKYGNFIVYEDMNVVYKSININGITDKDYKYLEAYNSLINKIGIDDVEIEKIEVKKEVKYVASITFENMPWLFNIAIDTKDILNIIKDIVKIETVIVIIGVFIIAILLNRHRKKICSNLYEINECLNEMCINNLSYSIDISNKRNSDLFELMTKLNHTIAFLRKEKLKRNNKQVNDSLENIEIKDKR